MKNGQFVLLLSIGILLTAFITNPSREKHAENATELLFNLNNSKGSFGILGGLVSTFSKETIKANIKIEDYYLFSKSYAFSTSRNKWLELGLGLFGQIIPLSDSTDVKEYLNENPKNLEEKSGKVLDIEIQNEKNLSTKIIPSQKVETRVKKLRTQETEDALNSIMRKPEELKPQDSTRYYGG